MTEVAAGGEGARTQRSPWRWLWLGLGWMAVGLGGLGVVVPGLPTTGFFVLAASCFARSSPRFERWVLSLPGIGTLVRDHRTGLGMPRRAKVLALGTMVAAVMASVVFALTSLVTRAVVLAAGATGVWYVGCQVPTRERVIANRGRAADTGQPGHVGRGDG